MIVKEMVWSWLSVADCIYSQKVVVSPVTPASSNLSVLAPESSEIAVIQA